MSNNSSQYTNVNTRMLARLKFFSELKVVAPEVLEDLKNSCLKIREKLCYGFIWRVIKLQESLSDNADSSLEKQLLFRMMLNAGDLMQDKEYKSLQDTYDQNLEDWGRKRNLGPEVWDQDGEWIIGQVAKEVESMLEPNLLRIYSLLEPTTRHINTILNFSADSVKPDGEAFDAKKEEDSELLSTLSDKLANLTPPQRIAFIQFDKDFVFSANWNPLAESRVSAHERIKNKFQEDLQSYLDFKVSQAEVEGLMPIPAGLTRKQRETEHRFEWLIKYQVQKLSKNKIANIYGVERKAIRESIKAKSSLIGLFPRL